MIYFSYFANWRKFPQDIVKVSIAQYPPTTFSEEIRRDLAPDPVTLSMYKSGEITFEDLCDIYLIQIRELNLLAIAKSFENKVLLCFEKDSLACHRSILMKELNNLGVETKEL